MSTQDTDPMALARQYWTLWRDALQAALPGQDANAATAGLEQALNTWRAQLDALMAAQPALAALRLPLADWLVKMQQVALRVGSGAHSTQDVVQAWREIVGDNPFAAMMQGMPGSGLDMAGQWSALAAPWTQAMREQAGLTLGLPAFGFTREHQARWQALGRAQLRVQAAQEAWLALLGRISQQAFRRFEAKLSEHEAPGQQLTSVRALFDVWVDAAEDAWNDAALSLEFRQVLGELINAQMQLRSAAQAIGEALATLLGVPGRTELDSAYRKLAELERRLRQGADTAASAPAAPAEGAQPARSKSRTTAARANKTPSSKRAAPAKAKRPSESAARTRSSKATPKTRKR